MNNKLIDYYEAENNPDTNDTVEDFIDELFGNIPLYHYINAMFARTEAEFEDSLIKGLEGSLNAFMSLPYASSMMGDIAVVEPQIAFVPEPYVPQPEGAGRKIPKVSDLKNSGTVQSHMDDYVKHGKYKGEPARPYIDTNGTNTLVDEIMQGGTPIKDAHLPNGLRWDVPGSFRDANGT